MRPHSYSTRGRLNSDLPTELVAKVWSYLTIVDLLKYATMSKTIYDDVHNAIRDTVLHVLGHYSDSPVEFLQELLHQHAVVSGSVVLHTMLSINFLASFRESITWTPNDIDIYIPKSESDPPPFISYMINTEHYDLIPPDGDRDRLNDLYPNIRQIFYLQRDDLRMDVIVANSEFTAGPIFDFHSTLLFNFITGNGLFSAYPVMTCRLRGLFNPRRFTLKQFAPALPPANVRHGLMKYVHRGFDIRRNPSSWPNDCPHICCRDVNCPQTTRNVEDTGCLYVTFRNPGEDSGLGMRSESVTRDTCRGTGYCLMWHLGGRPCGDKKRGIDNFITCRPEYEEGSVN
jgi:hypothetical protein